MRVFEGRSFLENSDSAVAEAVAGWDVPETGLSLLIVFASTKQDPDGVARALAARYPGVPLVGCTSTGESIGGEHSNGAVVIAGLCTPEMRWATAVVDNLSDADDAVVQSAAGALFGTLSVDPEDFDPNDYFCVMFVDGLRMREEWPSATMADALEGVPLLGGSAGDDLAFKETKVIANGVAKTNAAVFLMAYSPGGGHEILKHQHFTASDRRLVITRCDPAARRVYEIDGFPALEAYARVLGMDPAEVTGDVSFMNPVTLSINNELYVRSIQSIQDDGSLVFYCAVEEGMVLSVGGHNDMSESLRTDLQSLKRGGKKRKFLLACNCILRALEAKERQYHERLTEVLQDVCETSIGFDTYGEQLNGLHINQTLVAVALG
ncbi:MAG: FIST C-terminal domain-containing protein [Nannocystaceae bacterium]|nr:FIST C-terminal domain-containing protein [Nannocystaceae bacterium]